MVGRLPLWALTGVYILLWFGGVFSHWLWRKTPEGAQWSAPVFLACAAALIFWVEGHARAWLARVGLAGFLIEVLGSRTGIPFGAYAYTLELQPQWAGVPVAMFCAWVILIAYVKALFDRWCCTGWRAVAGGAAWMTAVDLVIDPVATAALDYWRWEASGAYYGIPAQNFAGWFVVSAALLASGGRVKLSSLASRRIGDSVVLFFGLLGAAHGMAAASGVALTLLALERFLERVVLRQCSRPGAG